MRFPAATVGSRLTIVSILLDIEGDTNIDLYMSEVGEEENILETTSLIPASSKCACSKDRECEIPK